MISKVCKKIFMVIFCLCYGSCWLDGNVSCGNPFEPDPEPETEEERQAREEREKEEKRKWQEMILNFAPCVDGEVEIGTQVWQKCNLNVDPGTGNSRCLGDYPPSCERFGRLYDWATAMALPDSCNSKSCDSQISAEHRGLCPEGWHIPSDGEWSLLIATIDDPTGTKLKATSGWESGGNGTDDYGFAALPGNYGYDGGSAGNWWTASESWWNSAGYASDWSIYYNRKVDSRHGDKSHLFSVRCVRSETPEERQAREEREEKERKEREERERQEREKEIEKWISNFAPCVDGTVKIGTQVWQKCNLNIDPGTGNSKCYGNYPASCEIFGRLYDWATAMALPDSCNSTYCASQINAKHKGLCPSGWHIPSKADWAALISYIESDKGCTSCAGKYLKVKGWSGTEALDSYGFSALPGGSGNSGGSFNSVGEYGGWWSASETYANDAYYRIMNHNTEYVNYNDGSKNGLHSVRCLQD